ncbi:hypothetical protein BvCmsNSP012_00610 [Escherichia coli]|nr:hypothetical protein BvCmsNSP012_00610 [Escherichia coli]
MAGWFECDVKVAQFVVLTSCKGSSKTRRSVACSLPKHAERVTVRYEAFGTT